YNSGKPIRHLRKDVPMPKLLVSSALLALLVPTVHAEDKVSIEIVDLAGLESAIASHKGKVVVADFWATFCIPCKKEFPNLVQLHKDRVGEGLVCMSVTINDPEDKERALKFLTQQK